MSDEAMKISPGFIVCSLRDRGMDGDQLGPVRERGLYLYLVDHLRHTLHHILPCEDLGSGLHEGSLRLPVSRPLHDLCLDDRHRLALVELETPRASTSGYFRRRQDQ